MRNWEGGKENYTTIKLTRTARQGVEPWMPPLPRPMVLSCRGGVGERTATAMAAALLVVGAAAALLVVGVASVRVDRGGQ